MRTLKNEQMLRGRIRGVLRRSLKNMEMPIAEDIRTVLSGSPIAEDQKHDEFEEALKCVLDREDAGHLAVAFHARELLESYAFRMLREEHKTAAAQTGVPEITIEALFLARIFWAGRIDGQRYERRRVGKRKSPAADVRGTAATSGEAKRPPQLKPTTVSPVAPAVYKSDTPSQRIGWAPPSSNDGRAQTVAQ